MPKDRVRETSLTALTAEWFQFLENWLDKFFESLHSYGEWTRFYCFLAIKMKEQMKLLSRFGELEVDKILVPPAGSICNVCRLLFQAICPIRIAVPDGQHRLVALLHLLTGHAIAKDSNKTPPRFFIHDPRHGGLFGSEVDFPFRNELDKRKRLTDLLSSVCSPATIRVLVPTETGDFEKGCERFSMGRIESQNHTKPRYLRDV